MVLDAELAQHSKGVFKMDGEGIADIRQLDLVARLRARLLVGDDDLSGCHAVSDHPSAPLANLALAAS